MVYIANGRMYRAIPGRFALHRLPETRTYGPHDETVFSPDGQWLAYSIG